MTLPPLPCPFCGHVGLTFSEGSTFRWLAYLCGGCGIGSEVRIQTMGAGKREEWRRNCEQDAIAEWNRRIPSDEQMRAYGAACAAAERDRIRQALLDMQAACRTHNHYAHAIVAAGLTPSKTTDAPAAQALPPSAA